MQAKDKETKAIVAAMRRLQKLELHEAFDAVNLKSRPTPQQQEIFDDLADIKDPVSGEWIPKIQYRMVIAGNQSGKSSVAAREIAWLVNENHPTWKRPDRWGEEPLLILIAGQSRQHMEIELWGKKIKPFLEMNEWEEKRVGGILNFVTHKRKGHKIIFLSHNESSESARQHLQGYVAHYVWLDEMPRHLSILEELQRRVDARKGYLIATFTPKATNDAIRKVVEIMTPPIGKRYRLSKLDNPLYAKQREAELQKLAGYSEAWKNTVLYGDWHVGDEAVYDFDTDFSVVDEIPNYSVSWRHVVSVDPALKSKFGFTLWAENPGTGVWYLIKDDYITGVFSPDDMVNAVQAKCRGLNIVKRISDPHESWFIGQAAKAKLFFVYPYDKRDRKAELIKGLQLALSSGKIKIASWCRNFLDEVQSCQWSETGERIINASSYHTLDAAQYFIDLAPPTDKNTLVLPHDLELKIKNQERKQREQAQLALKSKTSSQARGIFDWGVKPLRVRSRY